MRPATCTVPAARFHGDRGLRHQGTPSVWLRPFRAWGNLFVTQGGALRLVPPRSALGWYVAAPSGRVKAWVHLLRVWAYCRHRRQRPAVAQGKSTASADSEIVRGDILKNARLQRLRSVLRWLLVITCTVSLGRAQTVASEIATQDGLRLNVGDAGEVVSCRVDGRELLRKGARGGFFVADVQDIAARDELLVDNGSFEQVEAEKPVGWSVGQDWQLDRQVARSGAVSMRVSVSGPKKRASGSLAIDLPVKPNTPYRVSLWLRTQGCAPSFYIVQYDGKGKPHRDYPQLCVSHARTSEDWFTLGRSFTTAFFCHKIRIYCNVWHQTGTAWLDDVSVVCLEDDYVSRQRLAEGRISETAGSVQQSFELTDLALELTTTHRAERDRIVVDGTIEDTSGKDRAVTVSFRLPIDTADWTWFDDIQNQQTIKGNGCYGAARLLDGADPTQRRTISLYPFSAMGDARAALALAVPMDQPRVFRLCYDSRYGYFVNYEFGLTRAAKKFPGKAAFRFFIYRVDPQWGFRSAAKRYYELNPQYFVKRARSEGADRQHGRLRSGEAFPRRRAGFRRFQLAAAATGRR